MIRERDRSGDQVTSVVPHVLPIFPHRAAATLLKPGVGKPTENGKTEKTFSQFSRKKRKENVCSNTVGKTEKTENGF